MQLPPGNWFAPPGNRSGGGGDEAVGAFGVRVAWRLGERAGHNVSERWTDPEKIIAGADLTVTQGRPQSMEIDERTSSMEPAGLMAMACTHWRPDATREAPAVIAVGINWQLARDGAGPCGVAERSVVAMKLGNSGGGEGPQL